MRSAAFSAALLAGLLLAVPAGLVLGPRAAIADDKEDRKKEEEKQKRRKLREAEFKAIGAGFAAKDVAGLLGRVPKDAKVSLTMGGDSGEYAKDQARGVLKKYFDKFERITVEFTKADGGDGVFDMTVRKTGEDIAKARKLYVTVEGPDSNGAFTLTKLTVSGSER